jgi:hypothetical protein
MEVTRRPGASSRFNASRKGELVGGRRESRGVHDGTEPHRDRALFTPAADEPVSQEQQADAGQAVTGPISTTGARKPLLPSEESGRFNVRWQEIQASFVDEPRRAVEEADRLVADLTQQLAARFADERKRLEEQWDPSDFGSNDQSGLVGSSPRARQHRVPEAARPDVTRDPTQS